MPDPNLIPKIETTPGDPPTYSVGIAETFSWVPVDVEDDLRPLYARATYVVNSGDKTPGFSIPAYDTIDFTYVTGKDLYQKIEYFAGDEKVLTLTFTYDANDRITSVTKL